MKNTNLNQMISIALFAALIAISAYISIPLPFSPVPITMQPLIIMLAGLLLAPKEAIGSVLVWMLIGVAGMPVFAKGGAGFGILAGPTGGYILGFALGALVISLLKGKEVNLARYILACVVGGLIVVYTLGALRLGQILNKSIAQAFMIGAVPYLIPDLIKLFLASWLAVKINPRLAHINR